MSEEKILHNQPNARIYLGEKPKYKNLTYVGEQQLGSFILTNKRLLFLRKTSLSRLFGATSLEIAGVAGLLVGLPASLVIGDMTGSRVESAKIKEEEVEKVLQDDPESVEISLNDIVATEARRAYMMTAYLMVRYNTPQGVKAISFVFGTAAKNQRELAQMILTAKQNVSQRLSPEIIEETKFCIACGQKIPTEAEFCLKCGEEQ